MEIQAIYNTPVILEVGDLIALEKENNRLWIRSGDKLFISCQEMDKIDLESRIFVNSAGFFSRDERLLPKVEWQEYKPNMPKPESRPAYPSAQHAG